MKELNIEYMSTKEVKLALKASDCEVMHLREAGKLSYTKKGNAFYYLRVDVEKQQKEDRSNSPVKGNSIERVFFK